METLAKTTAAAMTTAQVLNGYMANIDASERTVDSYKKNLAAWHSYLTTQYTEDAPELLATRADLVAYKKELAEQYKPATVNARLVAIRGLYAYLQAEGVKQDITAGIKNVKYNRQGAKDAITPAQTEELLAKKGESLADLRDRAILVLMTMRGLRTVEITRANIGDIRTLSGKAVLYIQGKGHSDKDEYTVLSPEILAILNEYLAARRCHDLEAPLFAATGNRNKDGRMTTRSVSRIAKSSLRAINIDSPRITAHSLRHTAVTNDLLAGASIQEAQVLARHKNIETTTIYAHNIDRLEGKPERAIDNFIKLTA